MITPIALLKMVEIERVAAEASLDVRHGITACISPACPMDDQATEAHRSVLEIAGS
jgi:hypothetical protein